MVFPAALLGITVLVIIVYTPRLGDYFLSDDFDLLAVWRANAGHFAADSWMTGAVEYWPGIARPLVAVSGWLLYHIAGLKPFGWHLSFQRYFC